MRENPYLSRNEAKYSEDLKGLARECPECKIIAHYEVKGRKPADVECPDCGFEFTVQKFKRGERPKAEKPKTDGQKLVEFFDRMMGNK